MVRMFRVTVNRKSRPTAGFPVQGGGDSQSGFRWNLAPGFPFIVPGDGLGGGNFHGTNLVE